MDPLHWHATARHLTWALALVVCVTLVVFHLPAQRPVYLAATPAQNDAQTVARTVQGVVDGVRAIEAAKGPPAAWNPGLSAPLWNTAAAIGRMPTVTVYSAQYQPPKPAAVPTLQPMKNSGLPSNFEAWHHADTVVATEEALSKTPVNLRISQQEIQPNKVGAVYLANGGVGLTYAAARHGSLDLDLGAAKSKSGLQLLAGYGLNLKHTDAGAFVGVAVGKRTGSPGASVGITAGLVVHPQ